MTTETLPLFLIHRLPSQKREQLLAHARERLAAASALEVPSERLLAVVTAMNIASLLGENRLLAEARKVREALR